MLTKPNPSNLEAVKWTFDSVAAMVAEPRLVVGDIIQTLGYFNPGDGGGNLYEIVESGQHGAPDGGRLIALPNVIGQALGLFEGRVVNARQFGAPSSGSSSAAINAMNDFIDAHYGIGVEAVKVVFNGVFEIADQITLGTVRTGTTKVYSIDASGAVFKVIPGGNLESGGASTSAILLRNCHRTLIEFGQVLCDHICGGYIVQNCSNALFNGLHFDKFHGFGLWIQGAKSAVPVGNSSGSVFNKPTGTEWGVGEGASNEDHVSDGIINESFDVRISNAHVGWCARALVNRAGSCEWINCHPFNGQPRGEGLSVDRFCFWNEGSANVNIYDMYADNGYIVDEGGGLNINGLVILDLNTTMTVPYVRVRTDLGGNARPAGVLQGIQTDIGFYVGDFTPDFSNKDTKIEAILDGGGFDKGRLRQSFNKIVTYHLDPTALPDNVTVKGGGAGAKYVAQHIVGEEVTRSEYSRGYVTFTKGTGDHGMVLVNRNQKVGIESIGAGAIVFLSGDNRVARLDVAGDFRPETDNAQKLGVAPSRWSEIFVGNGTINTSDAREKQQMSAIPDDWLDAWGDVEWCRYKWNHAVEEKGESARWHVGLVAQQVKEAFEAKGIDPFEIGILCYDEWGDQIDDDGKVVIPAGNRYGLRHDQANALESAFIRRAISLI